MVLSVVKYHIYCFNESSFSTPLKTWNSLPFDPFPNPSRLCQPIPYLVKALKNQIWLLTFSRFSLPVGTLILSWCCHLVSTSCEIICHDITFSKWNATLTFSKWNATWLQLTFHDCSTVYTDCLESTTKILTD